MKIRTLAVAAWLALGALQVSAAPQGDNDNTPAKQDSNGLGKDAKDAGKSTGEIAKDSGKIAVTDTKKGVHKAASGLGKVADKLKRKTATDNKPKTNQTSSNTGSAGNDNTKK